MKKKPTKPKSDFCLFITLPVESHRDDFPTIKAHIQIIVGKDKDDEYIFDGVELMMIEELVFNGTSITGLDKINTLVDAYRQVGIKLDEAIYEDVDEIIACSGDVETFVLEQTGIKLP